MFALMLSIIVTLVCVCVCVCIGVRYTRKQTYDNWTERNIVMSQEGTESHET